MSQGSYNSAKAAEWLRDFAGLFSDNVRPSATFSQAEMFSVTNFSSTSLRQNPKSRPRLINLGLTGGLPKTEGVFYEERLQFPISPP
jgi:hypothetical protein